MCSVSQIDRMRLIKVDDPKFKPDLYMTNTPSYAVLSHRWRRHEVEFHDLHRGYVSEERMQKISRTCAKAKTHGFTHVWIDTCCIDKGNHTEYSETINSMFKIYMQAATCYVYMDDVPSAHEDHRAQGSPFRRSEWFTRGWTLQELIAPRNVIFYSRDWERIGTKDSLADLISEITAVDRRILVPPRGYNLRDLLEKVCIAERMSWAARRRTTREEDRAYSLMGIFNVHMPVLYGEGGQLAFKRLQEQIIQTSHDQTIFAWVKCSAVSGLLAQSPDNFVGGGRFYRIPRQQYEDMFGIASRDPTYTMTNYGIGIELALERIDKNVLVGYLAAGNQGYQGCVVGIYLKPQLYRAEGHYVRTTYRGSYYAMRAARGRRHLQVSRIFVSEEHPVASHGWHPRFQSPQSLQHRRHM